MMAGTAPVYVYVAEKYKQEDLIRTCMIVRKAVSDGMDPGKYQTNGIDQAMKRLDEKHAAPSQRTCRDEKRKTVQQL